MVHKAYVIFRERESEIFSDSKPIFDCVQFSLEDVANYIIEETAPDSNMNPQELTVDLVPAPNFLDCDFWYGVRPIHSENDEDETPPYLTGWQILKYYKVEND